MNSSPSYILIRCGVLLLLLLLPAILVGCGTTPPSTLPGNKFPDFTDDLDRSSLERAVEQSINYLQDLPPDRQFQFDDRTVSASWLIRSLLSFVALLHQSSNQQELQQRITEHFDVFLVRKPGRPRVRDKMLVTGYFEPVLEGSLTREAPFIHPLYRVPPDLVIRKNPDTGTKKIGRLTDTGELVPYWTRAEIEKRNLLAGHELLYLNNPTDAFILHVQGSGRIRLRDGSVRKVHYAGANGRSYRSIGRLLVQEGVMRLEDVDLPRIKQYLADNSDQRNRILHYNESFIFFNWEDGDGPIGSLGEPLTAGRSAAVDHNVFPAGALGFLQTKKPALDPMGEISDWIPLSRFVLLQDTGSAITGPGRLDLFWGRGRYAEIAAGSMKHPGTLYILLEKADDKNRSKSVGLF
jgi:membrane-bound lytic murein transglycosylase A